MKEINKKNKKNKVQLAVQWLEVGPNAEHQRVDNFLIKILKIPKARIYQMIRKGEVRVNKKRVDPADKLNLGDKVRVPPIEKNKLPKIETVEANYKILLENILYEDPQVLILNKPEGLAVHSGSGIQMGVIEVLKLLKPEEKFLELAHRLDKETSGCLIIAKSRTALLYFHNLFKTGQIKKIYRAWVCGHWPKNLNKIDLKLQINKQTASGKKVQAIQKERLVSERGREETKEKEALTTFKVLGYEENKTYMEIYLHTGRTHQIRVHCQSAGFPVMGDDRYGRREKILSAKRLYLHCYQIKFSLPDGKLIRVEAPVPF